MSDKTSAGKLSERIRALPVDVGFCALQPIEMREAAAQLAEQHEAGRKTPTYIQFADKPKSLRTEEILLGRVLADFDEHGNLIGLEVVSVLKPQHEAGPVRIELGSEVPTEPGLYLCKLFRVALVEVSDIGGELGCAHPNYVTMLPVSHPDASWSKRIEIGGGE